MNPKKFSIATHRAKRESRGSSTLWRGLKGAPPPFLPQIPGKHAAVAYLPGTLYNALNEPDGTMEKKRLAKFLAAAGIASRRACEELIFAGKVKINGKIVELPQTLVDGTEEIVVEGQPVGKVEQKVYFLLHKPHGYICTAAKSGRSKRVLDLFDGMDKRLFTVGRLDRDTSGLLIVTNDGHFSNRVIHPSSSIQKEYVVKTDKELTPDHLKVMAAGTEVEGRWVKPLKVLKVRRGTLKVVVAEGRKREVRRLVEAAGLEVRELKRTRIGGLKLGDLPIGHWRKMSEGEKEQIFQ